MDDLRSTETLWVEWSAQPVGRLWSLIVVAIGVLIIVVGAVLFSPDAAATASGVALDSFG